MPALVIEGHSAQWHDGEQLCARVQPHEFPQPHSWPQSHFVVALLQLQDGPQLQAGPQLQSVFLGSVFIGISRVGVELTTHT